MRPGAINGGLFVRGVHGLTDTFLKVRVSSTDDCLEKVTAGGGTIIRPKTRMLDFAYFAVVRDSEGNAIGLRENI